MIVAFALPPHFIAIASSPAHYARRPGIARELAFEITSGILSLT